MVAEQRYDLAAWDNVPALPVTEARRLLKRNLKLSELFDEKGEFEKSESSTHDAPASVLLIQPSDRLNHLLFPLSSESSVPHSVQLRHGRFIHMTGPVCPVFRVICLAEARTFFWGI